ncbi:TIGR03773 family transporter-associated surface protein [Micromonospora sp. LOL_023]|uniref:TIGR03773 family transporter-associated surface protein n=1 Tax=Micromonospora sp. LOL_023 TaxID=3345418 RepID=UPI003A857938
MSVISSVLARPRLAAAVAAGAMVAAATVPAPVTAAPPSADTPATVTAAGADLVAVELADGRLSLFAREASVDRDAAPGRSLDPATVLFGPQGGATVRTPEHLAFQFLGGAGRPMWAVTGGDTDFPYLDTRAVPRGAVRDDTIELSLGSVDGPGGFAAYTLGGLGQATPLFGTFDGMPRAARLPAATRTGGLVWLFDAAGEYRLTVTAAATLANGDEARADAVYQVRVPQLGAVDKALPAPAPAPAPASALQRAAAAPDLSEPQIAAPGDAAVGVEAQPLAAPATSAAQQQNLAAVPSSRVVIDDGHVDMGPQLDGSDLTILLKDDTVSPAVWRNLSDVVLQVKDNAKITVPEGADFLGASGDEVWLLPQGQQSGIVWPGWNTQHPSVVAGISGPVTLTFKGVTGPGRFTLFLTGSFGEAEVLFDSAASLPQRLDIPSNTHAHGNWAFSAPGIYRLAFEMSGTTTTGVTVTDTRTLNLAVGDGTDPDTGFGPGSGDGDGDDGSGGDGSGRLPLTGSSWHVPATGAVLLITGALVLFAVRTRRFDQCSS